MFKDKMLRTKADRMKIKDSMAKWPAQNQTQLKNQHGGVANI